MKKITAIQVQKNNPNRVNIYLDGEFAFGLARIVAAWLQVGQTLDEEKIAKLQTDDSRERAWGQALLYLSYRARSENEIRQNLTKHEIPDAVIEETLERCAGTGLQTIRNLPARGSKIAAPFAPADAGRWPWNSVRRALTTLPSSPHLKG
jgi:hypothetical protein